MSYRYHQAIQVLIEGLRSLKVTFQNNLTAAQGTLRDYVLDRDVTLEYRFMVWAEFCDKRHHDCVINETKVPLFGKMVLDGEPYEYDKYVDYGWDHFYDALEEDEDQRDRYGVTMEEVQELLIKTNFGSFTYDW